MSLAGFLSNEVFQIATMSTDQFSLPVVFLLSSPFPTQCKVAVTTVGSEKPSTFFTVRSTQGLNSSTSRLGRDILKSCKRTKQLFIDNTELPDQNISVCIF